MVLVVVFGLGVSWRWMVSNTPCTYVLSRLYTPALFACLMSSSMTWGLFLLTTIAVVIAVASAMLLFTCSVLVLLILSNSFR